MEQHQSIDIRIDIGPFPTKISHIFKNMHPLDPGFVHEVAVLEEIIQ